jgi:hypothetical protein
MPNRKPPSRRFPERRPRSTAKSYFGTRTGREPRPVRCMLAVAGMTTLLLAGCNGSGHTTAVPPSSTLTTSSTIALPTTSSTTVPTTPTSTVNSPTTSPPAATPHCEPTNLRAMASGQGGGAGHGGEIVTLTLVGDIACTTGGYPGLGLRNPAGGSVPLTVNRQPQGAFIFPYVAPATTIVTARTPAEFGIEWINETNLPASTLIVTPPNDFSSIVVTGADSIPENSVVTVTALTTSPLAPPCGLQC